MKSTRYVEFLIIAGLIAVFGVNTYQRNFIWKDDLSLWSDVVEKSPNKARPHTCLGLEYQRRSLTDRAILQYEKSISLELRDANAHNNLGLCYFDKGWIGRAIEQFKHAVRIAPNHVEAHYNLGMGYGSKGLYDLAFKEIRKAKELSSRNRWKSILKETKIPSETHK